MKEQIFESTILKAIKLHTVSLVIICFSILTGCDDDLTSSVTEKQYQITGFDSLLKDNVFNSEFILKPGEIVFFDSAITSQVFIRVIRYQIVILNFRTYLFHHRQ